MRLYRRQGMLLAFGITLGLGLATLQQPPPYGDYLIKAGLFILLFSIMVNTSFESLREAAGNLRFFAAAMATNFILIPVLALVLGKLFAHHPHILLGLVMYLVTPCTDWFLSFTQRAGGDEALGLILLPWNLVLQILLLPVYILLIVGEHVAVNPADMIGAFFTFIVLPFLVSRVVRLRLTRMHRGEFTPSLQSAFMNLQTISLTLVVLLMFAVTGPDILGNISILPWVAAAVASFMVVVFFMSKGVARLAALNRAEYVLLNFTASARNSPVALAIALAAFPEQPLAAAVIILAPLLELPVLSIEARILRGD
jgi:ACR3 family arsenite efflux pump ArsB